jgi:hypothetical protein
MNRTALAACVLGLMLPSPAQAQDAWEQQVRDQLTELGSSYEDDGYEMTHRLWVGSLDAYDTEEITLDLVTGQEYVIIGVCDNDCSDLDLVLYGDGDFEIDEDVERDAYPEVGVIVDVGGTFGVEIFMAACSADPCRYGLMAFARTTRRGGTGRRPGSESPTESGTAPDHAATPSYGTIDLSSGFSPDPHGSTVRAGGSDPVMLSGPGCSGYVHAAAPDLSLNYTAGSYPLSIYAESALDITLIVNQPDGSWVCSDDVSGTNPAITWSSPAGGNYDIWIGTYGPTSDPFPESTVWISEVEIRW